MWIPPPQPAIASLSPFIAALVAIAGVGTVCVSYGVLVERRWYRRRTYRLKILPPDAHLVTVLHLSDIHMVRRDASKRRFLASLSQPDMVIVTGDLLGEPEAVESVVASLRPLRGRVASYFVLGSNDYYAPMPLNYARYFMRERKPRKATRGRGEELIAQLEADGWLHLENRRTTLSADGTRFEVIGMDDPHIMRQDLRVASRREPGAVGLAVVHSPDPAPELAALGFELIVAGHTHGGQVRMPFVGALVTNCQVPTRICMGLSRIPPAYMHVSPGLGTSKFAPFRFLCRPEATVIELAPGLRAE